LLIQECIRQALNPLDMYGNHPMRLGLCPAQLNLNSRRSVLVQTVQDPPQVAGIVSATACLSGLQFGSPPAQ
jgi:hypothetical protein